MGAHPEWLGSLCSMMLRATWQASVLIVLVMLTQQMLRRLLPPQWRHALWMLVLVRLALPFSFQSPISLFNFASTAPAEHASTASPPILPALEPIRTRPSVPPQGEPIRALAASIAAPATSEASGTVHQPLNFSGFLKIITQVLPFLWLLGVALLLSRVLWANSRLSLMLRDTRPLTDVAVLRLAGECGRMVGLRQTPWIVETSAVRSPALFGFSVPRLLMPAGMIEKFSSRELRFILLHEFCHVRRRDIALNWLTSVLQTLHWFNPLVWFACSRMRADRELACAAQVLSRLKAAENREYGNTVIRLLESFVSPTNTPGLVGILEDPGQMKRRIRMISRFGMASYRWKWVGAACALMLAAGVLTDARTNASQLPAPGGREAEQNVVLLVLDLESGAPVTGARLNGKQSTDSQGRCELRAPLPTAVQIRAAGYVPQVISLDDGDERELTVHLERAVTIGGTVRNEEGKPVAGAEVHILRNAMAVVNVFGMRTSVSDQPSATTDADGNWVCSEAPRNLESLMLKLTHKDYAPTVYALSTALPGFLSGAKSKRHAVSPAILTAQQADLIIDRGFAVAGSIVDTHGKPVDGATVIIGSADVMEETRGERKTGADGRFVFRNGTVANVGMTVQAPGYAMQRKGIDLARGMPEIKIVLIAGERLRIHIVDDSGLPVPGALVSANQVGLKAKTDDRGDLLWNSAPDEPFMVHVHAEGRKDADEAVEAGDRENTIHLRDLRKIKVSGTVVDAMTRQPIPQFKVFTSTSRVVDQWQDYRRAATGKDGHFSLTLSDSFPSTGTVAQSGASGDRIIHYMVGFKIEAQGYFPDASQTAAIENGDATFEVALERGAAISGTVSMPGGEPVSGARVFLTGRLPIQMDSPGLVVKRFWDDSMERVTGQTGDFTFDPRKDARSVIAVHEKGIALIPAGKLANPGSVVLESWGQIEGSFRIGNRAGSNEIIVLRGNDSRFNGLMIFLRTETDAGGKFVFSRVPSGKHLIMRTLQDGEHGTVTFPLTEVEVSAGKTNTVTIGGIGRPVVGKVAFLLSGTSAPRDQFRAMLEIGQKRSEDCCSIPVKFAPDGSFRVEDVPAGIYQLRIFNPLMRNSTEKKVVVPEMPGGRSDQPLDLGTITIR